MVADHEIPEKEECKREGIVFAKTKISVKSWL